LARAKAKVTKKGHRRNEVHRPHAVGATHMKDHGIRFGELESERGLVGELAPPERREIIDFLEEKRSIPVGNSARAGNWSLSAAPYVGRILMALQDPDVRQVTLMSAAQVGKTEVLLGFMQYVIELDPDNAMLVLPDEDGIGRFLRNRLLPDFLQNEIMTRYGEGGKRGLTNDSVRMRRMSIFLSSSNAPAQLASYPCRYLLVDEADKCGSASRLAEGCWLDLARDRTMTFSNRKILLCSTPTTTDGTIAREHARSLAHEWQWGCQRCGGHFPATFDSLRFDSKKAEGHSLVGEFRSGKSEVTAECPHCGHHHGEGEKFAMSQAGRWNREQEFGDTSHLGFRLETAASLFYGWGQLVADFLEAKDAGPASLQAFRNQKVGQPWRTEGAKGGETAAYEVRRIQGFEKGGLPPGWAEQAPALFVGADWNLDKVSWVVLATTGLDGLAVVDWGRFGTLDELGLLLSMRYPLPISAMAVDAGWQAAEVYRFCASGMPVATFPVRGSARMSNAAGTHKATQVAISGPGGSIRGHTMVYALAVNDIKDRLLGATSLPVPHGLLLPEDADDQLLAELAAEERVIGTGGVPAWKTRGNRTSNHFWDGLVYAYGAALISGFFDPRLRERIRQARERTGMQKPAVQVRQPTAYQGGPGSYVAY
jgi:phage terminase large subunit GpA-like protein